MNILDLIIAHPFASLLAVAIPIRIYMRDFKRAKHVAAKKSGWDGIDRRGPNRARNVFRPKFGERFASVVERKKTGTHE